jgi:biotin synthase-related radical SAM superfamily protein
MKVFAKIETQEAVKNLADIIDTADGIILSVDIVEGYLKANKKDAFSVIKACKKMGKPIFIHYVYDVEGKDYPLLQKKILQSYCQVAVDGYMIETMIHEEDPLRICSVMFETLSDLSAKAEKTTLKDFYQ